jgi:drug/metabolite transporter (DMT)-like permease
MLGKRILRGMSVLAATTYAALTGTVMLAVAAAVTGDLVVPQASFMGWVALLFLGLFGTVIAFVWYYDGVKAIGPARTAVFVNLVPVAAVTLGVLLLGEPLELSMVTGGALVILGVFIINRPAVAMPAATMTA